MHFRCTKQLQLEFNPHVHGDALCRVVAQQFGRSFSLTHQVSMLGWRPHSGAPAASMSAARCETLNTGRSHMSLVEVIDSVEIEGPLAVRLSKLEQRAGASEQRANASEQRASSSDLRASDLERRISATQRQFDGLDSAVMPLLRVSFTVSSARWASNGSDDPSAGVPSLLVACRRVHRGCWEGVGRGFAERFSFGHSCQVRICDEEVLTLIFVLFLQCGARIVSVEGGAPVPGRIEAAVNGEQVDIEVLLKLVRRAAPASMSSTSPRTWTASSSHRMVHVRDAILL